MDKFEICGGRELRVALLLEAQRPRQSQRPNHLTPARTHGTQKRDRNGAQKGTKKGQKRMKNIKGAVGRGSTSIWVSQGQLNNLTPQADEESWQRLPKRTRSF